MVTTRNISRQTLLATERRRFAPSPHGRMRIAVGYPNRYGVAMSSLAWQWAVEITGRLDDVGVERFVADPGLAGRTIDSGADLATFDIVAFSCAFEPDATSLLRVLDAAGIPRRADDRGEHHPLIVVGGSVASINPLPLSPAVDVFVLGAAERVWPGVVSAAASAGSRNGLLDELASRDGLFVPRRHLDPSGRPVVSCRRLEKRGRHMTDDASVPSSHVVSPHAVYANRGLVEMSRGCPEKCKYCWVSHNSGRLRCYPSAAILARVEELAAITSRIGFVATALGDHPDLPDILAECRRMDLDVAVSSLRIPAMVPEVLGPLADSGARSVAIAPETGSDRLRRSLNKPIPNARILEAVETAQRVDIPNLKMYFIIGLPGETDDDLDETVELLADAGELLVDYGRRRGHVGELGATFSLLIPKPYTPYQSQPLLDRGEARRRLEHLQRATRDLRNLRFKPPSWREAAWQDRLSRGNVATYELLSRAADGEPVARLIVEGDAHVAEGSSPTPVWRFISSAPTAADTPPSPEENGCRVSDRSS